MIQETFARPLFYGWSKTTVKTTTNSTCNNFVSTLGPGQNVVSYSLFLPDKDVRTKLPPDQNAFRQRYFVPVTKLAKKIKVV